MSRSDKTKLKQRLAAAKRASRKRGKTVTVKKHTRQQSSLPSSLWRVNQTFNIEERILALARSVRKSSRLREDFICVAIIQEAVNTLRKELK